LAAVSLSGMPLEVELRHDPAKKGTVVPDTAYAGFADA